MTKTELLKTIRAHCIDCCCGQPYEVEHCGCPSCNLYKLRFGKDPTKRELTPEQKAQLANHFKRTAKNLPAQTEKASSIGDGGKDTSLTFGGDMLFTAVAEKPQKTKENGGA